ncbi:hypothetical protein LA080_005215 [Diaporthe eres]|nr:hypothetical protein LA080_005215 [Diaporthe eres]
MALDFFDSDSSYDEDLPLDRSTNIMNLRKTSRLKRPVRYRDDLEPIDPGRPAFVHQDPIFNMDRAKFVQWRSLELNEPSPGEAQYKMWQEQGEPRDAFGQPVMPLRAPGQVAESPRPTVAHLRRQSIIVRPSLSQPVVGSIEKRDVFDEAFEANLADFEDDELQTDDTDESFVIHPQLSLVYHDWSALSHNVQWAIMYDLANDHEDGITAAANLLGLTLDDVIRFVNVYVREKALWENGTYEDEPVHPAGALFQLDGAQDEVQQPVPEAGADQIMHEFEPGRQHLGVGATQTITGAEVGPPIFEGAHDVQNEAEVEPFHDTNTQVVSGKEHGQLGAEKAVGQTGVQVDCLQSAPVPWPPVVELITDSFSREDIGSGRSFLTFAGLQQYADGFGQWFGRGTTFREIPGIFDENNEFMFSTEDTNKALYSGNEFEWQGPVPDKGPAQREWLMEALGQDPAPDTTPVYSPMQQFQTLAERVNGRPAKFYDENGGSFDFITEGAYSGLRYGEPGPAAALADILAHNKSDQKEAERLTRKDADNHAGSDVGRRRNNNRSHGTDENVLRGIVGGFGDEDPWLFNTSSAVQSCHEVPEFGNDIARPFLEWRHVDIEEGYHGTRESVPQPYPSPALQLPPFLQPHEGIFQPADKAVPAFSSFGHNSSHVASSDQASQARTEDPSSTTPNPTTSPFIETSSKPDALITAEKDTHDASVTVRPASSEAINNAARSDAEGAAKSGEFSKNGIEIATFPKCYTCFKARSRCDGGRPCSGCVKKSRKCKAVTKAALDEEPERAERVLKDKAKADGTAAQAEIPSMARATASTPNAAVPALAASHAATSGVKRKLSAMTGVASTNEDDSDLDYFPPEKEDPTDGDYGLEPKKKKPKKGNTPVGKKQTPSQAKAGVAATPTPNKRRGPYQKGNTSTPKPNQPVVGAPSTPTPRSRGNASSGNIAAATSAQKTSAKAPAAGKSLSSSSSKHAGGNSLSGAGAGKSVNDGAEAVRHAGGQFGMTNARPVPVGKRDETPKLAETHRVLDPSLFSPNLSSGAGDSRYLNIPFAPVVARPHTPTGSGGSPKTASSLKTPMTLQEMLPITTDRMPLVPQIARPSLNGSPGATEISPTSQSSGSGTTASMDFSHIPFTPGQESPVHRDGSVSGRLRQGSSDSQSMSGFSPNFSAEMVPLDSPSASQRWRSVSSYNNGAHSSGTGVPFPVMDVDPRFRMSPGLMSPYAMFQQQRSTTPRPISRIQEGPGYPVPQQTMHPSRSSSVFYDRQSEEMRPGPRGVSASPASQQHNTAPSRPVKRQAEAPLNPGQQPARKKLRGPASPLAPPREAGSWRELAHSQWATETQENQPDTANFSVKPLFGGDGSFDVSFSRFTRIHEQIDPELQQTAMAAARKMNKSSAGIDEKL